VYYNYWGIGNIEAKLHDEIILQRGMQLIFFKDEIKRSS